MFLNELGEDLTFVELKLYSKCNVSKLLQNKLVLNITGIQITVFS